MKLLTAAVAAGAAVWGLWRLARRCRDLELLLDDHLVDHDRSHIRP